MAPSPSRRIRWIIIAAALVSAGVMFSLARHPSRLRGHVPDRAALRQELNTLFAPVVGRFAGGLAGLPERPGAPLIRGKVLVVATSGYYPATPTVDDTHWLLPDDLRPAACADVGMAACLAYEEVPVGVYQGGRGTGFRWLCRLALVDLAGGAVVYRQDFIGGMPPDEIAPSSRAARAYGEPPLRDIAYFIDSMPRARP